MFYTIVGGLQVEVTSVGKARVDGVSNVASRSVDGP